MLRVLANVGAVAVACVAWAALTTLILDAAGVDPLGLRPPPSAPAAPPPNELCALAAPLGQGFDRHCDFTARLVPGGDPYRVTLDETWEGATLVQRLVVAGTAALPAPAYAVTTRSASNAGATRLSQVALVPARPGLEHLVYSLGNCGGVVCGQHDVIAIGLQQGGPRELLRARLGRAGGFEVRAGGVVTLEPFAPAVAGGLAGLTARTYVWDGTAYLQQGVTVRSTPSPSPSTR